MNGHLRTICFFIAEMVSPGHVGSGRKDDPFSDCPILRTQAGIPFIPGGSWAGIFCQSLPSKLCSKWMGQEDPPKPSRVIWNDALPVSGQRETLLHPVDTHTSVTILRRSLTAKPDHLFSSETLPIGTQFPVSCRMDAESEEESNAFIHHLKQFLRTAPRIGGKVNAGLGRWKTDALYVVTLNLKEPGNLALWMKEGHGFCWSGKENELREVFKEAVSEIQLAPDSDTTEWSMTLKATIQGLHMVAGSSGLPVKDAPDTRQAERQRIDGEGKLTTEFVDFGTSVKGQVRTIMEMLLRTHLKRLGKNNDIILRIVPQDPAPKNDKELSSCSEIKDFLGHKGHRGGFRAEEMVWRDADTSDEDHIQLCEFTQQVIDGAKFQFAPLCKGSSELVVSLPGNAPGWQKELVAQAGKLLSLNLLPFGGHASRGYLGCKFQELSFSEPTCQGELKRFLGGIS